MNININFADVEGITPKNIGRLNEHGAIAVCLNDCKVGGGLSRTTYHKGMVVLGAAFYGSIVYFLTHEEIIEVIKNFGIIRLTFTKQVDFESLSDGKHRLRVCDCGLLTALKLGEIVTVRKYLGQNFAHVDSEYYSMRFMISELINSGCKFEVVE